MTATRKTIATITALAIPWLVAAWLLWDTMVPDDLTLPNLKASDYFSAAHLEETADYERFVRSVLVLSLVATVIALIVLSRRMPRLARSTGLGPIGAGMIVGMVMLVVLWAVNLPFSIALRWWDQRHDLAEGSWFEWLVAPWAELGGAVVYVMLVIALVMAFARRYPRFWWAAVTPVFFALTAFFLFIAPYLLAFGVNRPKDPQLRQDVRVLAARTGAKGTPVDVEKMSDITSQANAFASGLGPTERIVLWDTLLDGRFNRGEVRVVVAHEFTHIARHHLWKGLGWFVLFTFPVAFVVAEATRRRGGLGDPGLLPYGMLVLLLANVAIAPFTNLVSRRYEAEADWGALKATRDPRSMEKLMQDFSETSLGQPDPPEWSQLFFGTHPTLMQRIEMAEAWKREQRGSR
ncbi:MAG TPA: M48 family metalloprotease [Gaiellaceae bacterium]|nr:M48 family metalloprotease [Gaiellaceae bacterium]